MKFNVTVKFENEDNDYPFGEIANFVIEGDYQTDIYEAFEKNKPVEVRLNDTIMGKYRITEFTSKIEK